MGGNTAKYRKQIARTCKKFGLLVQPNALPVLARELQEKGNDKFLELLSTFQDLLAKAPSPKLVTLALVEEVVLRKNELKQNEKTTHTVLEEEQKDAFESSEIGELDSQANETNKIPKSPMSVQTSWRIVSAFESPKLLYDSLRRQFRYEGPPLGNSTTTPLMGTATDLLDMRTQRYELVKQKVERYRQQHRLEPLTTVDRLLGTRSGNNDSDKRTLLGMIKTNQALGCLELEDPTGSIPLAISRDRTMVDPKGVFLEGSLVLVRGNHEESESLASFADESGTVFRCSSVDLPSLEFKEDSLLTIPPSPLDLDQTNLAAPVALYSLSNLCLNEEGCLDRIKGILNRMEEHKSAILVLFGNFCTETCTTANALEELATLLKDRPQASKHSVLLVPGPRDMGSNACWPLPAFHKKNTPASLHPFLAKENPTGGMVHLCTNPCRLEFSDGRQVVLLRKDLIRESLQHNVLAPTPGTKLAPLASRVFHHAMSQCHLSNGNQQVAPIYWKYDHAMSLFPLPDLVVVGLDAEYLEEGALYGRAGCRFVAPISNPSRGDWQCAIAVLNRKALQGINIEFDNEDDEDTEDAATMDRDPYDDLHYRMSTTPSQLSEQLSAF